MKQTHYRNWMKSDAANAVFAALDNNARFVGGAVRDAMLGYDAKDIDIITPFLPDEVTNRLQWQGIKVVPTGIKHGTVTAITSAGDFEITTLRRDIDCFGRHAKVEFTDNWEEDAARRDFTINAMSATQDGKIFDYFNGCSDLEDGYLRFVGDAMARCKEDYLRILRFFRFFAYYGRRPVDSDALHACSSLARGIEGISGERIQSEMLKLFAASDPIASLQLMQQAHVVEYVIPRITAINIEPLAKLILLENIEAANPILRLAVFIGNNIDIISNIAERWKLSNNNKKHLLFLCDSKNRIPKYADDKTAKKLLRVCGKECFIDMCLIGFAFGMDKESFNRLLSIKNWSLPKFPIIGDDLLSIGLKEGKEIGAALKIAESWWEDNNYKPSKKEIVEFIKLILDD